MAFNKFIDVMHEDMDVEYDAGRVFDYDGIFIIAYSQKGAEETFSIGQPVFDEDGNLMGYLGIGMYCSLNYASNIGVETPVEHWTICRPTNFCKAGKQVFTYYQNKNRGNEK